MVWGVFPLSAIAASPRFGLFVDFEGNSVGDEKFVGEPPLVALSDFGSGACASQALPLDGGLRFASISVSSTVEMEGTEKSPDRITRFWKSSTTPWWLKNGAPNSRLYLLMFITSVCLAPNEMSLYERTGSTS